MSPPPALLREDGPTGAVLGDLPSPYLADPATGLLHLPRFLAKIRKHLAGTLPRSYQRNFRKGFDRFLCLHLGVDPDEVVEAVREATTAGEAEAPDGLDRRLAALFPADLRAPAWNRQVVQIGMSPEGQVRIREILADMGVPDRADIRSFADLIELDEGRIPGFLTEPSAGDA